MTDAKKFKNCFVNIKERICILMLHLFTSCSINYPLCAELILKQFTFNHRVMFILYFQIYMLITFPIVVCGVFWAGGLSLHLYIE